MDAFNLILILKALILTIFLEEIMLFFLKEKKAIVYLIQLIMNIITNVSLNIYLIFGTYPGRYYNLIVIGLEIAIIIVEALIYNIKLKNFKISLKYAFFCNIFSYLVGILVTPFYY